MSQRTFALKTLWQEVFTDSLLPSEEWNEAVCAGSSFASSWGGWRNSSSPLLLFLFLLFIFSPVFGSSGVFTVCSLRVPSAHVFLVYENLAFLIWCMV
jgi:hypothetical protein